MTLNTETTPKIWIHSFSLRQLCINISAHCAFYPWYGNLSRRRKTQERERLHQSIPAKNTCMSNTSITKSGYGTSDDDIFIQIYIYIYIYIYYVPKASQLLRSHIHEYGHVRNGWNGHRMLITIEHIKNIGISEFENT